MTDLAAALQVLRSSLCREIDVGESFLVAQ